MHVLAGLTKLRQICNSPALINENGVSYGDQSAKIQELLEQIEDKKKHHKILVFSQFVGMLKLIEKALEERMIPYSLLTGQTKKRKEVVDAFQGDEKIRVFLISLKAGGMGLNLTQADYVYLIDPWWNPAVENQAIDRAYRIGQDKKVVAVRFITPNTIEEKILELQRRKQELVGDLVHTDVSTLKQLNRKELIDLL
jgi:SNF2 family DNA or RNA helicase